MTIAGMTALALAIVLSLVLVAHFLFGSVAAGLAGGLSFGAFALLWTPYRSSGSDHEPAPRSRAAAPGSDATRRGWTRSRGGAGRSRGR